MIKGKIYLINEIIFVLSMIFVIYNDIELFDYIGLVIEIITMIIMILMYKTKKKMFDNYKTGYPKNSYKNIIFNVFMSKEEKDLKLRTDWVLDKEKIRKKLEKNKYEIV